MSSSLFFSSANCESYPSIPTPKKILLAMLLQNCRKFYINFIDSLFKKIRIIFYTNKVFFSWIFLCRDIIFFRLQIKYFIVFFIKYKIYPSSAFTLPERKKGIFKFSRRNFRLDDNFIIVSNQLKLLIFCYILHEKETFIALFYIPFQ